MTRPWLFLLYLHTCIFGCDNVDVKSAVMLLKFRWILIYHNAVRSKFRFSESDMNSACHNLRILIVIILFTGT